MVVCELWCINKHPRDHQISPRRKSSKHLMHFQCSFYLSRGKVSRSPVGCSLCVALVYIQSLSREYSFCFPAPGMGSWKFLKILRSLFLPMKIFNQDACFKPLHSPSSLSLTFEMSPCLVDGWAPWLFQLSFIHRFSSGWSFISIAHLPFFLTHCSSGWLPTHRALPVFGSQLLELKPVFVVLVHLCVLFFISYQLQSLMR